MLKYMLPLLLAGAPAVAQTVLAPPPPPVQTAHAAANAVPSAFLMPPALLGRVALLLQIDGGNTANGLLRDIRECIAAQGPTHVRIGGMPEPCPDVVAALDEREKAIVDAVAAAKAAPDAKH